MTLRLLVLAACLLSASANAQDAAQSSTPETRALAQKLMLEINSGIQCSMNAIVLQQQLTDEKARTKELEDKYEPKPEAK